MVLGACATWSLITAAAHDGRPEGVLLAVLAVAAGYAAGRICGALLPVAAALRRRAGRAGPGGGGSRHLAPGPRDRRTARARGCHGRAADPRHRRRVLRRLGRRFARPAAPPAPAGRRHRGGLGRPGLGRPGCVTLPRRCCCARSRRAGCATAVRASPASPSPRPLVTGLTWAVAEDALPDGLAELAARAGSPRTGSACGTTPWPGPPRTPPSGWDPGRFGELSTTAPQSLLLRRQTALGTAAAGGRAGRGRGGCCWRRPSAGCCTRCGARPAPRRSS